MQALTNSIDDLLEEWEEIKHKLRSNHSLLDNDARLKFVMKKFELMEYSQKLRQARLVNNVKDEAEYAEKFVTAYTAFSKDYVFGILKNG